MYSPVDIVEVRIWGKAVGAVALDPRLGYYVFEYQPSFLRSGIDWMWDCGLRCGKCVLRYTGGKPSG